MHEEDPAEIAIEEAVPYGDDGLVPGEDDGIGVEAVLEELDTQLAEETDEPDAGKPEAAVSSDGIQEAELTEGVSVSFDDDGQAAEPAEPVDPAEVERRIEDLLAVAAAQCSTTIDEIRSSRRAEHVFKGRWIAAQLLDQVGASRELVMRTLNRSSEHAVYLLVYKKRPDFSADLEVVRREAATDLAVLETALLERKPEFDSETAGRLVTVIANYFSLSPEHLSERSGNQHSSDGHVQDAKWVVINLLRRMNASPAEIADRLGYTAVRSVYGLLDRQSTPELSACAEEIWAGFETGNDFAEGVRRAPQGQTPVKRTRRRPRPKPDRVPGSPELSAEDIDRLVLTAANYFGVDVKTVTNPRMTHEAAVLPRTIIFSLLEGELGIDRKHVARHFDRVVNSIGSTLTSEKGRQRLLNNHGATSAILKAFKEGDTLDEWAEDLRREREAAGAKEDPPLFRREVPTAERELFEAFADPASKGHEEAVATVERLYLPPVRKAMRKQLKGSKVSVPEEKPREVLHLTARHFLPIADRHESFQVWVEKVAQRSIQEILDGKAREKIVSETDPEVFVAETYGAYQDTSQSWEGAVSMPREDKERLFQAAEEVYLAYLECHKKAPVSLDGFRTVITRLHKTYVVLQNPQKGRRKVPSDSLARSINITEFKGELLKEVLEFVFEAAIRNAEANEQA
ncbi:MAG TPA: hypothetical protein VIF43_02435 [Patescibacteria group bacterium]|jgi:AraC-like DNA-binding protein